MVVRSVLLLIFAGLVPPLLFSQVILDPPGVEQTGVQFIFVPAIAYTSDLGLVGGGVGQRIDYGDGVVPFRNSTVLSISASTKGLLSTRLSYDRTRTLNRNIRSGLDIRLERFLTQNYFGVGNHTGFDRERWESDVYYYEHREVRIQYKAHIPLPGFRDPYMAENGQGEDGSSPARTRLELLVHYEMIFNRPGGLGGDTLFETEQPYGSDGGWVNAVGLGLLFEQRDSEFDPRRGVRYETRLITAPEFLGEFGHSRLSLNLRHYLPLFQRVTLAHQIDIQRSFGNPPFWNLPVIGSEYELRGYPEYRFRGEGSWVSITELRAWFYEIEEYQIKLGVHTFWDTGRVFQKDDNFGDVFRGLKHTAGFGGAATLFSPDLIFRGDIGFSEDMYRIYFGIGYLF